MTTTLTSTHNTGDTETFSGSLDIGAVGSITGSVVVLDGGVETSGTQAYYSSADASGGVTLIAAPGAGLNVKIYDLLISCDTDMSVELKTGSNVFFKAYISANLPYQITPRNFLVTPDANTAITMTTSVAGNISVTTTYFTEA